MPIGKASPIEIYYSCGHFALFYWPHPWPGETMWCTKCAKETVVLSPELVLASS